MSAIKLSAKKVKDVSNLQKIAEAWHECVINRGWVIGEAEPGDFWLTESIECMAGAGKSSVSDMVLNDPYVWVSPGDKYASKIVKDTICYFNQDAGRVVAIGNTWVGGLPFDRVNNSLFDAIYVLSYCFIAFGPVSNIPLNTTPLAFTRGLCTDGKWDEKAGLYGSKGGYVVYCDGHVTWFDGNNPARFLKWNQSGYTSDIRYAVPTNAEMTCSSGNVYKGDNEKLIIWDRGL
ncbi:MAG: hypothetical protein LBR92_04020 [Puniceicoccales bacterium]|jgi:prepilin-type processing-associated H-X9-DG protein|nr:hypothetical protein [Puniceicoccales bacterium]